MSTPKEQSLALLNQQLPTLEALISINLPSNSQNAHAIVLQEIEYLEQISMTNPAVLECVPKSVEMAVKSVLKNNLSLDPNAGLVYVKTRNIKVGNGWGKVLEIQHSVNGILSIAYQCGKIIDHKNPVIKKDGEGKVIGVEFEYQLASYRWEKREFDESDIERWKTASHKENRRAFDNANDKQGKKVPDDRVLNYSNVHYTSWKGGPDPEFIRAKAIRHSLKKLGTNANEKYATKIQVTNVKQVVIDTEKDMAASNDDGFTQHEEVRSETHQPVEEATVTDAEVVSETTDDPLKGLVL